MSFHVTNHAEERMQQRGLRPSDIDTVLLNGTPTDEAVILTRRNVESAIREHKRRIAQLERLVGLAVFTRESAVVTLFRPTAEQLRKLLRESQAIRRVRRKRGA
jgi:hypothetical protein